MSSKLKFFYFDIKNIYSEDGKYLKHFNGNGIWIKDEIENDVSLEVEDWESIDLLSKARWIKLGKEEFDL